MGEILRENDEKFSKRFARCTNFLHTATDRVAGERRDGTDHR